MYRIRRIGTAAEAIHNSDFSIDRPFGYDCYLMLFVKTKAVFYLGNEEKLCEPNTFIIYNAGTPHRYKACGEKYINDWVQFDCDESGFSFADTLIHIGESADISGYIKLLSDAFYRRNYYVCSLILKTVLAEVSAVCENLTYKSAYSSALIGLRKEIYLRPEQKWTIQSIAERLHLSEPYLQELYKGTFGITCGADIIHARIDVAKQLMADTNLSITEIGEKCGYSSLIHFSRQFRKTAGISPTEYRKLIR